MFANLDEVQQRVRDPFVRRLFAEAIASFRAGSLRGATVTLWTAVVFDIVAKLRELELTGDAQAATHLRAFEVARERNDMESALKFEREILVIARDNFELISHQEHDDLARLQADRHRCAHPSMNSADEPYMPSHELVRYHLHSASHHLFIRPPVQGKAALQRLFDEVRSPFFPKRIADAARLLQGGALGNAKPSLVRNFVLASMKACLVGQEATDSKAISSILLALAAVRSFLPTEVSGCIADGFPRVSQQLQPEFAGRIFRLAGALPEVLDHLPDDVSARLEAYLEALPEKELSTALQAALAHPRFAEQAKTRLVALKRSELTALVSQNPVRAARSELIVSRVLDAYCDSGSWDASNALGPLAVVPLADALRWTDIERILRAVASNDELKYAWTTKEVLTKIRDAHPEDAERFTALGEELKLGEKFETLFPQSALPDEETEQASEEDLPF